jgi:hypothetical protein
MIHGRSILLPTDEVTLPGNNNFWRRTPDRLTICSASILGALGLEDNVFSIYCVSGEF